MFYVTGTADGITKYWTGSQFDKDGNKAKQYNTERGAVGAAKRLKRFPINRAVAIDIWNEDGEQVKSVIVLEGGNVWAIFPRLLKDGRKLQRTLGQGFTR